MLLVVIGEYALVGGGGGYSNYRSDRRCIGWSDSNHEVKLLYSTAEG